MQMETEWVLLILGILILFSYVFDVFARRTKFPSILLLVMVGVLFRMYADANGLTFPFLERVFPAIGTIGLILIVLEGSLELSVEPGKRRLIVRAFLSALLIMGITVTLLTLMFHLGFHMPVYLSLINAIPLSIISSAVAIPSTIGFRKESRDFIIYESSLSAILGIIIFNHTLANQSFHAGIVFMFLLEVFIVLVVSLVCSFLLIKLLELIEHKVKYILVFAVLVILYVIGKLINISSLMLIFFFGLFMANCRTIFPKQIHQYLHPEQVGQNLRQLQMVTGEAAFLIKTFFFLIFGYTIVISKLSDPWLFLWGGMILALIFVVRFVYLKLTTRGSITPEVFIAPRGLINILLFLSIPVALRSDIMNQYVLLIVFLGSLMLMIWGGVSWKKPATRKKLIEEASDFSANL